MIEEATSQFVILLLLFRSWVDACGNFEVRSLSKGCVSPRGDILSRCLVRTKRDLLEVLFFIAAVDVVAFLQHQLQEFQFWKD